MVDRGERPGAGAGLVVAALAGAGFRVIAFDLPWHGRSNPPREWWLMEDEYKLTTDFYCGMVMAFCAAVGAENPVIMGSSMGGNICIPLAHRYPDKIRALVALEANGKEVWRAPKISSAWGTPPPACGWPAACARK